MEAKTARTIAVTAVAPLVWGSAYVVTRGWLPAEMPLTGAAVRALPAGLLLVAVARRLPHGDWWWRTAVVGALTIGGFFALVYVAASRLPSGVAAMVMAMSAVVTTGLARLLLDERTGWRTWLGGALGLVGVAMLVGGAVGRLDPVGLAASVLAMLSASLGFVLAKRWRPPVPAMTFASWQLVAGGVMLLPVALLVEGVPRVPAVSTMVAFGYLIVVATALAYVCWFHGLARLPASAVGLVGLLNPVAGALLGAAVLGERLGGVQIAGAAVILGGVALGVVRRAAPSGAQPVQGR